MTNTTALINRKSLADEVADGLRKQLSLGIFKVNEKLPIEPELMKMFGVGRSTIREAIKLLVNSGLLRVQQGLGTFVERTVSTQEPMDQRLKRADKVELDEVRQLIEIKIAEKAALNRSEEDLEKIQNFLEIRKKAADDGHLEECIDADIQFHLAIANASKNEVLADIYKTASAHLKNWFQEIHKDTLIFQESYPLHQQLLHNIIAKDPKAAWNTASRILNHIF